MSTSRASWMRQGKFGMMVHWCVPKTPPQFGKRIEEIDKATDRFDLDRFIKDFRRTKADWLIFTIGQGSGFASPNQAFDRIAGPGHCTRRDLVLEIAKRVEKLGKRFITYMHCSVEIQPDWVRKGFGWEKKTGDVPAEIQKRYTAVIAEYSRRFGKLLNGWWFDGGFPGLDHKLWLRAARAGNPRRAVTFNDGSFCLGSSKVVVPGQDCLAGETEFLITSKIRYGREKELLTPITHVPQPPPTCLWHALIPIDAMWEHGIPFNNDWQNPAFPWVAPKPHQMEKPLYAVDDLETVVRDFKAVGGGVTFNVGIFQEGGLGPDTVSQLAELATRVR